jgi:hypothetical protein
MIDRIRKLAINAMLAVLYGTAIVFAYFAADRDPPSFFIASWVTTRDNYLGGPVGVRLIFVRYRIDCTERIEQRIEPGDHPLPALLVGTYVLGLSQFNLKEIVPIDVEVNGEGQSYYVVKLFWTCPYNPVQWLMPITMEIRMPITVRFSKADDVAP